MNINMIDVREDHGEEDRVPGNLALLLRPAAPPTRGGDPGPTYSYYDRSPRPPPPGVGIWTAGTNDYYGEVRPPQHVAGTPTRHLLATGGRPTD